MKKEVVIFGIIFLMFPLVYAPVEVETTTPEQYKQIWVQCEATVEGVTSIKARIGDSECVSRGWLQSEPKIRFLCTVPAVSSAEVECYVDPLVSYTATSKGKGKKKIISPQPSSEPPICPAGSYVSGYTCKKCGGVRFCSGLDIYYCGINDGVCPSTYGANCQNHIDCSDPDC